MNRRNKSTDSQVHDRQSVEVGQTKDIMGGNSRQETDWKPSLECRHDALQRWRMGEVGLQDLHTCITSGDVLSRNPSTTSFVFMCLYCPALAIRIEETMIQSKIPSGWQAGRRADWHTRHISRPLLIAVIVQSIITTTYVHMYIYIIPPTHRHIYTHQGVYTILKVGYRYS